MAEKNQKFLQNCILYNQKSFYRLLSKLYSTCLGNFEESELFWKKCVFIFFWNLSGNFSGFWCNLSRHGFQKCILHVQNKILRRSLLWNHIICWYFPVLSSIFSGFWWKNKINSVVRISIKSPDEPFWIRKIFLKQCKTMVSSGFRAKTLLCLTGNFFGRVFKTAFFLSGRTFVGENELSRKDTSFDAHCRTLSRNLSDFWQEIFGRVIETAFFVSQRKFWSKNLSFKNEPFY